MKYLKEYKLFEGMKRQPYPEITREEAESNIGRIVQKKVDLGEETPGHYNIMMYYFKIKGSGKIWGLDKNGEYNMIVGYNLQEIGSDQTMLCNTYEIIWCDDITKEEAEEENKIKRDNFSETIKKWKKRKEFNL